VPIGTFAHAASQARIYGLTTGVVDWQQYEMRAGTHRAEGITRTAASAVLPAIAESVRSRTCVERHDSRVKHEVYGLANDVADSEKEAVTVFRHSSLMSSFPFSPQMVESKGGNSAPSCAMKSRVALPSEIQQTRRLHPFQASSLGGHLSKSGNTERAHYLYHEGQRCGR
jgi:hypothetical protein